MVPQCIVERKHSNAPVHCGIFVKLPWPAMLQYIMGVLPGWHGHAPEHRAWPGIAPMHYVRSTPLRQQGLDGDTQVYCGCCLPITLLLTCSPKICSQAAGTCLGMLSEPGSVGMSCRWDPVLHSHSVSMGWSQLKLFHSELLSQLEHKLELDIKYLTVSMPSMQPPIQLPFSHPFSLIYQHPSVKPQLFPHPSASSHILFSFFLPISHQCLRASPLVGHKVHFTHWAF